MGIASSQLESKLGLPQGPALKPAALRFAI